MSLTHFLELPDVKAELRRRFAKPPFESAAPLLAPPRTAAYALTGTAFDYLFRFAVLKQHGKVDCPEEWVATTGVARAGEMLPPKLAKQTAKLLENAVRSYNEYTRAALGLPGSALIDASISLAQLDLIVRIGRPDFELPLATRTLVAADLKGLLDVIPTAQFRAARLCLPNPTFGPASMMVGGADSDLILDRTLWDVKATKNLAFSREMFNQLIGYVCLSLLGGIDGCKPRDHRIERVGIYFARHAVAFSFDLAEVPGIAALPDFLRWIEARANRWMAAQP